MQAIILAAGLSKRLRPLTDNTPKCLLKIGTKNLLGLTIGNILRNGIDEFIIVTGYREDMIKDYISQNYPQLRVTYLTNSGYAENNNSYSLWMTKDYVRNECILLDSDILFDYRIISKLLGSEHKNCLAVNANHRLGEEEIKLIADGRNKILQIGKHLNPAESIGESIGIEKFSGVFFKKLGYILERKIVKEKSVNEFYEASFQEMYDAGNDMFAIDVSEYRSMEIDTPEDFEKAKLEIKFFEN